MCSMTETGEYRRTPVPDDPDPGHECQWPDPCHTMVHEDEEGEPLCYEHYLEQIREEQADTMRKQQKEDF